MKAATLASEVSRSQLRLRLLQTKPRKQSAQVLDRLSNRSDALLSAAPLCKCNRVFFKSFRSIPEISGSRRSRVAVGMPDREAAEARQGISFVAGSVGLRYALLPYTSSVLT